MDTNGWFPQRACLDTEKTTTMSMMQRTKGKVGEREVAGIIRDLTGWDVRRRVRQHDGDSDLVGAPGWSIEVKRRKSVLPADLINWWAQSVSQSGNSIPLVIYRADRRDWRAVWPVALRMIEQRAEYWRGYEWTVEGSLQAWAAVAREVDSAWAAKAQAE